MNNPHDKIALNGKDYLLTWIRTNSLEGLTPITQVYGVCFDRNGKILIARSGKSSQWQIPGGTPENDETIEQTLKRELIEETDAVVKETKILGVQKVQSLGGYNETIYQVRCICKIEKLLPQTVDPASGRMWERKLVSYSKVSDYIKWGKTGETMFRDAWNLYNT